jgi:organic hydroperoxide reductase OsmC/OhrA
VTTDHRYEVTLEWTGNRGTGTSEYRAYGREHTLTFPGKPPLPGSSDRVFMGDALRYNPDELLVASLSACHMLWYLHLCSQGGVVVEQYTDEADGILETGPDGSGQFTRVTLRPRVVVRNGPPGTARELHEAAHAKCFIARSVNFPVRVEPTVVVATAAPDPKLSP